MRLKHLIENLIFVSGEPISIKKMAQILELDEANIIEGIKELKNDVSGRGLEIVEKDKKIQMTTSPEAGKYIEKFIASNLKEDLSEATLETLAAISYLGPITKPEIEELRGVNCAFTLRNLLIRGLVEKTENSKNNKIPLYKTSFDFLKKLGIKQEGDLPDYEKYRKEVEAIITQHAKQQSEENGKKK